jgi:hypothetical protein
MRITYIVVQGTRTIGYGLVARSAKEINEMVEELSKVKNSPETHATIVKIEKEYY